MPSTHPLTVKPWIRPQDLAGEAIIAVSREPLPEMHQELEEFFSGFGISLRIVADAFAPPEAVAMVEHGERAGDLELLHEHHDPAPRED